MAVRGSIVRQNRTPKTTSITTVQRKTYTPIENTIRLKNMTSLPVNLHSTDGNAIMLPPNAEVRVSSDFLAMLDPSKVRQLDFFSVSEPNVNMTAPRSAEIESNQH